MWRMQGGEQQWFPVQQPRLLASVKKGLCEVKVWHGRGSAMSVRDAVEATLVGRDIRLVQRCDVDCIVAALEGYTDAMTCPCSPTRARRRVETSGASGGKSHSTLQNIISVRRAYFARLTQ